MIRLLVCIAIASVAGLLQAETLTDLHQVHCNGRDWGIVGLDTGEYFIVDIHNKENAGIEKNSFTRCGDIAYWQLGDTITFKNIAANVKYNGLDPGFGVWSGTRYSLLNNHRLEEYVVLGWHEQRKELHRGLYEDRVLKVIGDEIITEGQARHYMPEAQKRWRASGGAQEWQPGDRLVCFSPHDPGIENFRGPIVQPRVILNPARGDIERNISSSRAFLPFANDILTYTVTKTKRVQHNGKSTSQVTLSDGSVFMEYFSHRLQVGDEIVLRQRDHYHWRSISHPRGFDLAFSAIRVDTYEEIDLTAGEPDDQSFDLRYARTCVPTHQKRQFLIGNEVVEVRDDASYEKVLSWGPKAKVTLALANHGEDYILLNLSTYSKDRKAFYDESFHHWVDVIILR